MIMKNFCFNFLLFLFCLGISIVKAQSYWTPIQKLVGGYTTMLLTSANGNIYARGQSLLRSTDSGESWQVISQPPYSSDDILSGIDGTLWESCVGGLYCSTNYGDSWIKKLNGFIYSTTIDSQGNVYSIDDKSILYKSTNKGEHWDIDSSTVGIGVYLLYSENRNDLVAATWFNGYGLSYSTDRGSTWQSCKLPISSPYVLSFISSPLGFTFAAVRDFGIIRSSDKGATWVLTNSPPVSSLAIDSLGIIYAAGQEIIRSTNFGLTWETCSLKGQNNYEARRIIAVAGNNYVYSVGNGNGIYLSADHGISWQLAKYLNSNVSFNKYKSGIFYVNMGDSLLYSGDIGRTWKNIQNYVFKFLIQEDGSILIDSQSGIFRSNDNGSTWNLLWSTGNYYDINSLSANNTGILVADIYYIGPGSYSNNNGIIQSTDNGSTWNFVSTAHLPTIIESNKNGEFFGSWGSNIFHSSNGVQWTIIKSDSLGSTHDIFFDSDGNPLIATYNGLYKLTIINDSSETKLLANNSINSLCVTDHDEFFATTDNDVIYSKDEGITWQKFSSGLPASGIRSITIDNDGYGLVSTLSGIFRSTGSLTNISSKHNEMHNAYILTQNYPNPFNPTTTISYSIPKPGLVTLKVYDILGREIATLVNENKLSGNYEIKFNASNLASGIYFYQLHAGNFIETKKLILLK